MFDVTNIMCADVVRRSRRIGTLCCHAAVWFGVALFDSQTGWSAERWNDSFVLAGEAEEQLQFPPASMPNGDDRREGDEGKIVDDTDALPLRPPPSDSILEPRVSSYQLPTLEWDEGLLLSTPLQAPTGYSGPSSVRSWERQEDSHFVPVPDRWRIGYPPWVRYEPDHSDDCPRDPFQDDAPYAPGWCWNPYRQNVLKGDYPIIGQHTFFNITASSVSTIEFRQVPTPTTPFETTPDPGELGFFGNPDQFFFNQDFRLSFELFHGDAAFKPFDWKIRLTPVFNMNYLDVEELGVVNASILEGTTRYRTFAAVEELFFETKLADTSPDYDFVSARVGSQPFVSDFRGFIFADVNNAVRLFGTRNANRDQFNFIVFDQREKDTNSTLNSYDNRTQTVAIANYYRQDFIWPGYTSQVSAHYNRDRGHGLYFDKNGFLARPDPVGVFEPHSIDAVYLGWAGDGHINRYNVSHAFYWAFGRDDHNPLAGQAVTINAQMAAAEVSYDRDWMRFRSSAFWASGDDNILDDRGRGFDAIFDNPNFAGGEFSYWQRQAIKLLGVNLTDRFSLVPHLRSSKIQGQTNFVNPGLLLVNFGADAEVTPRTRLIGNVNFLWFENTNVIEQFVFQPGIDQHIGTDLSLGVEHRPLLNDNLIFLGGVSTLIPGSGFKDIYNPIVGSVEPLLGSFVQLVATF
ncbi:MAG: hypothetical protein WD971_11575 [Pirellulales bacterium]